MISEPTDIISSNPLKGLVQQQQQPQYKTDDLLTLLKQKGSQAAINTWSDYRYYKIEVNVIPADTKNKGTHEKWSEWQNNPITEEIYREWKDKNRYSNGMALIPGKVWRGTDSGKFLVFIDLDNQKAIDEVCYSFDFSSLEHLSEYLIVEQHKDNKTKAHYIYTLTIFLLKRVLTLQK